MKFLNPLKLFINILDGNCFSNLFFFRSKVNFYVYKKKIIFLKILNSFFKLVNFSFDIFLNGANLFSQSSFFYFNSFFFKFNGGFLKLRMQKQKIVVINKFLSCFKSLKNNLSLSSKFFFINF